MTFCQARFDIRCEWGLRGMQTLAPVCDAIIVVDVLSFTTAVTIACARGAMVFPYRWRDDTCGEFARAHSATLAGPRSAGGLSLSPVSMQTVASGCRIVLPSPNGSTISLAAGNTPVFAGCLRNARSVSTAAAIYGPRIGVIPCGERWQSDDSLRPALEDLLGAGAIIDALPGAGSPEARIARAAFLSCRDELAGTLMDCVSGRELIGRDHSADVALAAQLDTDDVAPMLANGGYFAAHGPETAGRGPTC